MIFGARKKKNKSVDVDLTPSVCSLIDPGQQPMKMHTEVTLLYKLVYMYTMMYIVHTSGRSV